jgi:hypothetical protein
MSGNAQGRITLVTLLIPVLVTAAVLLTSSQPLLARPPAAIITHTCTPTGIGVFANRIHVRCSTGGEPGAAIVYFAYCTAQDAALSARFLSTITAAKATGKNLVLFYDQADLSGTSCSCSNPDCRLFQGLEMQQ